MVSSLRFGSSNSSTLGMSSGPFASIGGTDSLHVDLQVEAASYGKFNDAPRVVSQENMGWGTAIFEYFPIDPEGKFLQSLIGTSHGAAIGCRKEAFRRRMDR
jgi:hypothetical protein